MIVNERIKQLKNVFPQ